MGDAFLCVLSVFLVVKLVASQRVDCPDIYQRFSQQHSYCKPINASCNIVESYLTQQEMDQILELHNSFRSVIATQQEDSADLPPAADMLQMEWDDELAAVAQNYANQCIYAHDCSNCRRVRNFGVGQNIAIQRLTGHNLSPPRPDWSFAVGDWFEEIVYFSSDMVCPFEPPNGGGEYRHFTELIWSRSFRIGCGYVMYKHANTYTRLYICNYGPAGNIYDTCVYNQGPACSQCPENTCCGDSCPPYSGPTYPGLCKRTNDDAPVQPLGQPNLFYCDFQDPSIEDCLINIKGSHDWYIIQALGGNYLETVLNAGQNSTIIFSKTLKPSSKQFCVQIRYRKGPNKDIDVQNNKASETFIIPSMNDYTYVQNLPNYDNPARQQFSSYNLTLQWDQETTMKVSFAVGAGAKPQFFNIDSILAVDNACQN